METPDDWLPQQYVLVSSHFWPMSAPTFNCVDNQSWKSIKYLLRIVDCFSRTNFPHHWENSGTTDKNEVEDKGLSYQVIIKVQQEELFTGPGAACSEETDWDKDS